MNIHTWLECVYDSNHADLQTAATRAKEDPAAFSGDPWLACALGQAAPIREALGKDPAWANQRGGPLGMPPLVAVTHSRLIRVDGFEGPLLASARLLLEAGADVNGAWTDPRFPGFPLSVLYGAAGRSHHAGMTRLLLDAGAKPDDNESLYHSTESRDPACMNLLLDAGARVTGTNAVGRVLDYDKLPELLRLLEYPGAAAERPWIHHAILRGRSLPHIRALLDAGADSSAQNHQGLSLYRYALLYGRTDVAALLPADEPLTPEEQFIAACARGDGDAARALQDPGIFARLTPAALKIMPELAAIGNHAAIRTMLKAGWPREVKAGWDATALNMAVFAGDAAMADLLLEYGADWTTPHGFNDNVIGTLSYASRQDDIGDPAPRDFTGCARVLLAHGIPRSAMDGYPFPAPVKACLDNL